MANARPGILRELILVHIEYCDKTSKADNVDAPGQALCPDPVCSHFSDPVFCEEDT